MRKSDAEQYLAKRKVEVAQERIHGPKPGPAISFATFADDFLATDSPDKRSKDRDKCVVEMLKVEWKDMNLDQITPKMIEDYKAKRLKHRAAATVAIEVQIIKRLFKKAAEWGKVGMNPAITVKKPRVNNGRVRYLEPDEMNRLMGKLPEWLRAIATFARFTGARRGEILNLTWQDVDFKRG
jgi:integrase